VGGAVDGHLAFDGLVTQRVALVGVALQEADVVDLLPVRAVVLEDVEAVAQVDRVDQPVSTSRPAAWA
jgi:hypothetical protein